MQGIHFKLVFSAFSTLTIFLVSSPKNSQKVQHIRIIGVFEVESARCRENLLYIRQYLKSNKMLYPLPESYHLLRFQI